tara:strand:+ start:80 stop:484 length:405 start_codon:yes stop_codon:yes gene_type:complete
MKSTFELNIVTPVNTLSFNDVEYLRAPSIDGLFGVMPRHITSIIALDIGEIKIKRSDEILRFSTSGGYVDINSEKVILVLETAEEGHKIDSERAKESIERATKHLEDKSSDINRAMHSIKKAKNRIAISKKLIK